VKPQPALRRANGHGGQAQQAHQRQQTAAQSAQRGGAASEQETGVGRPPRLAAKLPATKINHEPGQSAAQQRQRAEAQHPRRRGAKLLAADDVSLAPRQLAAMRRRFMRLFANKFGHEEGLEGMRDAGLRMSAEKQAHGFIPWD